MSSVFGHSLKNTFMCFARKDPSYFSREGEIGFVNSIAFMLNFVKKSMQLELDLFMGMVKDNENKGLKYEYKTNINILIGKFKDNLVLALLEDSPKRRDRAMKKVIAEITKNRIPIRIGRQVDRKLPRKKRFHMNKKDLL